MENLKKTIILKKLPERPGVYLFNDATGNVLYIGKAINVKKRVSSYFQKNLISGKTQILVNRVSGIETIPVNSELEALLLEASLIKRHQPFFNSRAKDDKHPLYIRLDMDDEYPRIFLVRRTELGESVYFGPFPSSLTIKRVLSMLRHIFPYDAQKTIGKKPCFWSHIGLCDPCPSMIKKLPGDRKKREKLRYRKNIRNLINVLSGKMTKVRRDLMQEMEKSSKNLLFEEAQILRDKIKRLDYITQPYNRTSSFLENPNLLLDIREGELASLSQVLRENRVRLPRRLRRIECFDASHTGMTSPTVGMVTFVGGEPEKSLYRKFKIKKGGRDDLSYLEEALVRRFSHKDWGWPDLLIIDGGKTQAGRAMEVIKKLNPNVPVIGLVKPFDDVVIPHKDGFHIVRLPRRGAPGGESGEPALRLIERLRDEAHRFSRAYHFQLRSKRLFGKV